VHDVRWLAAEPGLESEEPNRSGRVLGPRIRPVEHGRAVLGVEREVLIRLDSDQEMQDQPACPEEQRAPEHRGQAETLLPLPGDEQAEERDRRSRDEPEGGAGVLEIRRRVTPRLNCGLGREGDAHDAENARCGWCVAVAR